MFRKKDRENFKTELELGSAGSLLLGPAMELELQKRWGPRPDSGDNVRLRYFYFSLKPTGHKTFCGRRDFFAIRF